MHPFFGMLRTRWQPWGIPTMLCTWPNFSDESVLLISRSKSSVSLTEVPLPDPIPRNGPEMDRATDDFFRRTQSRTQMDPKRTQTDPNGPEKDPKLDRNQALWGGTAGGFVGMGGGGGCKGKRKSLA